MGTMRTAGNPLNHDGFRARNIWTSLTIPLWVLTGLVLLNIIQGAGSGLHYLVDPDPDPRARKKGK
jgi:hypothetical protein